jgi:ABC-2 type transport system ATP-binding protein
MSLLRIHNLQKIYPAQRSLFGFGAKKGTDFIAVNGISFELAPGEVLGFLGPNGAGKTTTMHMLLGILTPTAGSITYFGKDFAKHRSEILQSVGFASAYTRLPGRLTIYENLSIYARLYAVPEHERSGRIKQFLQAFGMWELRNKEVAGLSAGQLTRIMLAKAFIPQPKIVLLDEPTASLDPDIAREVRHFIAQQQKEYGTAILFASHNMQEVSDVCNRVLVLQNGNIIASDTPKNLSATVSKARVELIIIDGLERALAYAQEKKLSFTVQEHLVAIEVDEHAIAKLLADLAQLAIGYSSINITKPTLEDYFLQIATQGRVRSVN